MQRDYIGRGPMWEARLLIHLFKESDRAQKGSGFLK